MVFSSFLRRPQAWALILGFVMLSSTAVIARGGAPRSPPWRVYLSWEDDPRTSVTVSAQVQTQVLDFRVEYGPSPAALSARGFAAGKDISQSYTEFRYTAQLTGLSPGTTYYYRAGSPSYGWSPIYHFATAPEGQKAFTFLAVADMGTTVNASATLRRMANQSFAFVLHPGDISYAGANQANWTVWFTMTTPVAANQSYMVVPGNHENGSLQEKEMFRDRFAMPWAGPVDLGYTGPYYSFNYSNAHFIGLSVDTPHQSYPSSTNWDPLQTRWLEQDLRAAANDTLHPWIIVYLHFPLFSSTYSVNGTHGGSMGSWLLGRQVWGALFDEYHISLVITGHKHNYERTYPVWSNGAVANTSRRTYDDPKAPIYVVTGGGGEALQPRGPVVQPWSAVRAKTNEFIAVTIESGTLKFVAISSWTGALLDNVTIVKRGGFPSPRLPRLPPTSGPPLPTTNGTSATPPSPAPTSVPNGDAKGNPTVGVAALVGGTGGIVALVAGLARMVRRRRRGP